MSAWPKKGPGAAGALVRRKVGVSEDEGIIREVLGGRLLRIGHHLEGTTWTVAALGTPAWLSETAHPATKETNKAAVLTANNVLAI